MGENWSDEMGDATFSVVTRPDSGWESGLSFPCRASCAGQVEKEAQDQEAADRQAEGGTDHGGDDEREWLVRLGPVRHGFPPGRASSGRAGDPDPGAFPEE